MFNDKELIFETIMHVRDSLIANETLNGKKNIYLSCEYEATFLMDPIEGSRVDSQIDLSAIDKKERLNYIDHNPSTCFMLNKPFCLSEHQIAALTAPFA